MEVLFDWCTVIVGGENNEVFLPYFCLISLTLATYIIDII